MNIKTPLKPHKHYIFVALSVPFSGGECIKACTHDARRFEDDIEHFWKAIKSHEKMILIVAPAIKFFLSHVYNCVNSWQDRA